MEFRRLLAAGFRFCDLAITHLPSCSPWLHRVLLHGFIATMRALTSAGPLQPTFPVSPCSLPFDGRYSVDRPGPLVKQCPSLLVLTVRRPRPVPDRSPCLSRLTFRPFHLQPPSRHFVTVAFIRYITAVTCRVYPPGRLKVGGIAVARSRVRTLPEASPTGLAESSSHTLRTGRSSQVALHLSSRKRSYHFRLQAGNVRLGGTSTLLIKRLHRRTGSGS